MAQQPGGTPPGAPQQPSSTPLSSLFVRPVQPQSAPHAMLPTGHGQLPLQTLLAAMQQQPQQPIHSNILEQIRALVPQPRPTVSTAQPAPAPPLYTASQARPPYTYQPNLAQRPAQTAVSRPSMAIPPRPSMPLVHSSQQALYQRPQARPYVPSAGNNVPVQPVRPSLPPQPLSEEDRRLLPLQSVRRMARAAFGPDSGLSEEVETALMELADEWITSSLTLGCGAARKRKSAVLMPEHVAKSLEPLWNVRVPGAGSDTVSVQKRAAAPELHHARGSAVRRALAQASAAKPEAGPSAPAAAPVP